MNKKFDTLYARDSKSKVLEWTIEVQSNGSQVDIKMAYGEYKGAKALRWQRDIQGKNIGKANETNAYEQAVLQVESTIRLKKKKGYLSLDEAQQQFLKEDKIEVKASFTFRNITEDTRDSLLLALEQYLPKNRTDADGNVKPMKAQQYYRSKKNWTDPYGVVWSDRKYFYLLNPTELKEPKAIITKFPCMGQPKINGVRCTIQIIEGKVVIKSKEGKIYNVAHIVDFLNINIDIFNYEGTNIVLDGELYIHGELLQDIGSAINKPNLNTPRIVLILFDIAIENETNLNRWKAIKFHIKPKLDSHLNCPIQLITTIKIEGDAGAQAMTDTWINQGYEGSIFRQFDGEYAFGKRPQAMTKLKRTISHEFIIVDIVPQDKDSSKGNFICITAEGARFAVNPKGTDMFKREVLYKRESLIGERLTCNFYEWTKDKLPFHILNNTIRNYE